MTVDHAINLLVTITLIEMMVAIGLGVSLADLLAVMRDWRLMARATTANYVFVSAVCLGLLWLYGALPMVSAGLLILAVCPGDQGMRLDRRLRSRHQGGYIRTSWPRRLLAGDYPAETIEIRCIAADGNYRELTIHTRDETIQPLCQPTTALVIAELLPEK